MPLQPVMFMDSAMPKPHPPFIAVDWGTTHLRAYLVDAKGEIIERAAGPEGISALAGSGFATALYRRCGAWLDRHPDAAVLMAGMIGSRNGWREAPYIDCPASPAALSRHLAVIALADRRPAFIVPGMKTRNDGIADVLRGEETLLFGAGTADGVVVLPGTHSKWALLENHSVAGFRTYMTGEFYGLLRDHSILRLLAEKPEDYTGFRTGLAAAGRRGGVLHQAFAARTAVLDGAMTGHAAMPYLSGLLIGAEIGEAIRDFGAVRKVTLIAEDTLAARYGEGFASRSIAVDRLSPATCLVRGAARILAQHGALQ
jgi:2-dehydro-3-deoxygalactonokinase